MDSPLLSHTTETGGTSETCRTVSTTMDPNETNWIVPVNDNEQENRTNPSIYMVPAVITKPHPEAYRPQVVSFGPYHHGEKHLHPMEEHKKRALDHFVKQSGKTHVQFFEDLRKAQKAQHLEESYDALDTEWKNGAGDEFLKLMITDGCFMLKIMRDEITRKKEKKDYEPNDRVANLTPYIRRDMLLLENQLPMQVLELLKETTHLEDSIPYLILNFYSLPTNVSREGLHVLDVLREGLLTHKRERSEPKADGDRIIRSATKLNEAGVRFAKSGTCSLEAIFFDSGVLRLPILKVDDTTKSMFLNIMAFERLHAVAGTGVTSYVIFMDNIINNEQDVALLHSEGIIQNALGSDEAVAKLFNSLCEEVALGSNNSLDAVQKDISEHCKKRWNRWRATLNGTYFRNPWTVLSLMGAISLFVLTLIQTVYVVLTYY